MPSILCSGLFWWTSDQEILQILSPTKAKLIFDEVKRNGKSKGNVEIQFESEEDAKNGIEVLKAGFENIQIVRKPSDPERNAMRREDHILDDRNRNLRDKSRDRSRDRSRYWLGA